MRMSIGGVAVAAALTLATIWAFNRFTATGVASLGKK
jgi:hypothetical protein